MSKPRIAVPITAHFSVRYLLRTGLIKRLAEFSQPVVLLGWDDIALRKELLSIGSEVHILPKAKIDMPYHRIRRALDVWYLARLCSPSTGIRRRLEYKQMPIDLRLRLQSYSALAGIWLKLPKTLDSLIRKEAMLVMQYSNIRDYQALHTLISPDCILSITPHTKSEQLFLRAAQFALTPKIYSVLSFDNLTTRGWLPITFDAYYLWNSDKQDQLLRGYPEAASSDIRIIGAPQFDFYWDNSYIWDEIHWRKHIGLQVGQPVILYGAGHPTLLPHEPHWLLQLDNAITAGEIPHDPVILLRRHPNDTWDRWSGVLRNSRNIVMDEPWAIGDGSVVDSNISREDIEKLASTLKYSAIHINACSTMTIDGAIFDRPQIGPAYDDRPGKPFDQSTKELYELEHYRSVVDSGGLQLAFSRDMMIDAIVEGFRDPLAGRSGRRQMIRDVITYDDGLSTNRLVTAIREFLMSARNVD